MPDTPTANLALPLIQAAQAQKHVTHNEALLLIDTLLQLAVLDRDLALPPGSPSEGQRWIVGASPSGAWTGHAGSIAAWQDDGWQFSTPRLGWTAFVIDEGTLVVWNGTAWGDFFSTVTSIQNLVELGVGTTANATNPFSAKLNNALWTAKTVAQGGDGHLRYKLSKESSSKTLSLLFQDNFSGRAEIGLTGDDDFHFKVSSDGSSWAEGIKIDRATGKVSFPVTGGPREMLTASRTYYVRTDGSDSNTGLANTSGGAFLTIQKAINAALMLDFAGFNVTIQVADGTYTGAVSVASPKVGAGMLTIQGNTSTPANVVWSVISANCLTVSNFATIAISGVEFRTTTSGYALEASTGGQITVGAAIRFGACASGHIYTNRQGVITMGSYSIVGNAPYHWVAQTTGELYVTPGNTITLIGTPTFNQLFAFVNGPCIITCYGLTFSGAATGQRFLAANNGVILVNGATPNSYLPGNVNGATSNGGVCA